MIKPLRVACLGGGYFSQFHIEAWQRHPETVLLGVADHAPDRLKELDVPTFVELSKMLEETTPDIVDIITPPTTHLGAITVALKARPRAIICQKPFCASHRDAKKAVERARDAGIPLVVHENFRFQPWYREMKTAILRGDVGALQQVTFRFRTGDGQGPEAYLDRQPYFQKMERFLIHETAVHWIDTFMFLLGTPSHVYADLRRMNPIIAGEDAGYILFDFDDGVRALFDGNRLLDHASQNTRLTFGEALIEGTQGSLELNGDGCVHHREKGSAQSRKIFAPTSNTGFAGDSVYALQDHVVRALAGDGPFENLAESYLDVLKIEDLIYRSDAQGRKIAVKV